jgi:hypothetical protein
MAELGMFAFLPETIYCVHKIFCKNKYKRNPKPRPTVVFLKEGRGLVHLVSNANIKSLHLLLFLTLLLSAVRMIS